MNLRLGLQLPLFTYPGVPDDQLFDRVAAMAVAGEESGFDHVFVMDHFWQLPQLGPTDWAMLEGYTLLAALAARRLLDEACLTVAPLLAGPGAGRITTGQPHRPLPLRLLHLLTEDDSLFLRYAVEPGVDQE